MRARLQFQANPLNNDVKDKLSNMLQVEQENKGNEENKELNKQNKEQKNNLEEENLKIQNDLQTLKVEDKKWNHKR